jgi:hypothetical protein
MVLHQPQVQRRKIEVRSYIVAGARTRNQCKHALGDDARVPVSSVTHEEAHNKWNEEHS